MRRRKHEEQTEPVDAPVADTQPEGAAPEPGAPADVEAPAAPAEPSAAAPSPDPLEALRSENEDLRAQLEQLRGSLAALEDQVQQEHNQYLRTLADFQNFRRRAEDQRGELQQFANRELVLGLLPILDNFERALAAAEQNHSFESLMEGVQLTLRQAQDYLRRNGVEQIDAVGKEFDPNYHEAVMRVTDSDQPENTVVDEVQRGYMMHSRVLRPSMVRVARSE